MPIVSTKEVLNCHEIQINIEFIPGDPVEQAFKKSLMDSFKPEKQAQYIRDGQAMACVDCTESRGIITITGLAGDINDCLHSPPLVLPDDVLHDRDKQALFWNVGNIIYGDSRCQDYRERDNELGGDIIRLPAHHVIFEQVSINSNVKHRQKMLETLIDSVEKNEIIQVAGAGPMSPTTGKFYPSDLIISLMPVILGHPKWLDPYFRERFQILFGVKCESSSTRTMFETLGVHENLTVQPVAKEDTDEPQQAAKGAISSADSEEDTPEEGPNHTKGP